MTCAKQNIDVSTGSGIVRSDFFIDKNERVCVSIHPVRKENTILLFSNMLMTKSILVPIQTIFRDLITILVR